jgi:hypothetical protein
LRGQRGWSFYDRASGCPALGEAASKAHRHTSRPLRLALEFLGGGVRKAAKTLDVRGKLCP